MKNKILRLRFISGLILGAALCCGSYAVAAEVIAHQKTASVIIDGIPVDLKGYIIEGSHYFQLRDLDEKLKPGGKDFSVIWDSANSRILIDTSRGYDPNETFQDTPPAPEPTPATIDEMRSEFIRLTNIERVNAGVPELIVLPELMVTAQKKADDMLINNYYGHKSPVYGTFGEMIKAAIPHAKSCAENIASWTKTPLEVVSGLMDSPGHRANMLNRKYTYIGVGIIEGLNGGYWWVQHFVEL